MILELMPFIQGLMLGFSLIIAIGPQNSFVIRQGILNNNIFIIALTCSLLDAALIFAGVMGFGSVIVPESSGFKIIVVCGIVFLLSYGFRAFRSAFRDSEDILFVSEKNERIGFTESILSCLALTLLNPHAYLDTVVLIGSVGVSFVGNDKNLFAYGAICASFIWFFGIGYAARFLLPIFQRPISWKILDFIIGVMMCIIAVSLIWFIA